MQIVQLPMMWLRDCGWSLVNEQGNMSPKNICEPLPVSSQVLFSTTAAEAYVTTEGKCLSLDNTFRSASKASVVDTKKARTNIMKGGLLSGINELNEIVCWVCHILGLMR
jgi:hypothetical protein